MKHPSGLIACSLICIAMLTGGFVEPATKPATGAEATAVEYLDQLLGDDPVGAIQTHWNWDAVFTGIFGDDMAAVSAEEQAEMASGFETLLGSAYADPEMAEVLATAEVVDLTAGEADPSGNVVVEYGVKILVDGETLVLPNAILLAKDETGTWRVSDLAFDGQPGMPRQWFSEQLSQQYQQAKQMDGTTPQQFVAMMTATVQGN